jgi:hypothetical protein
MKTENKKNTIPDEIQNGRREAIKKAGYILLSTTTMMLLMNTQAKAQDSPANAPDELDFD